MLPSQSLNLVLQQVSEQLGASGGSTLRPVGYHLVYRREVYGILYGILLELSVMVGDCFQVARVNFDGAFVMITRTCPTSTRHILMRMKPKAVAYLDILGSVILLATVCRILADLPER